MNSVTNVRAPLAISNVPGRSVAKYSELLLNAYFAIHRVHMPTN